MKKLLKDISILVVDDDTALRETIRTEFEIRNCKVLSASNGAEALRVLKGNDIDVVVSDIRMPGGDGIELLDEVRALDKTRPAFIFITGYSDFTVDQALDRGADGYFNKPFNRKDLIKKVTKEIQKFEDRWETDTNTACANEIHLHSDTFEKALESKLMCIGRGGVFISSNEVTPLIDQEITFKISLAGQDSLTGTGTVRWASIASKENPYGGYGVELASMSANFKELFIKYVTATNQKAFIPKPV